MDSNLRFLGLHERQGLQSTVIINVDNIAKVEVLRTTAVGPEIGSVVHFNVPGMEPVAVKETTEDVMKLMQAPERYLESI